MADILIENDRIATIGPDASTRATELPISCVVVPQAMRRLISQRGQAQA
jgi:hypothetical protein